MTTHNKVTLAAGCFWGVEDILAKTTGVLSTRVGYTGGQTTSPTYESICRGDTGHAEAVEVTYDPDKISFREILMLFFRLHDPTTLNRQGPDIGHQYRSAIFYHNQKQLEEAQELIKELDHKNIFSGPIVTELTPAQTFWPAEEYHQKYFQKNPGTGCHFLRDW